jgi:HK97 family phage major capsid protein
MRDELKRLMQARDKVEHDVEALHNKAIAEGRSLTDSESKMVEILERRQADLTASIAAENEYLRHDRKQPSVPDINLDTPTERAHRQGRQFVAPHGPGGPEAWLDAEGREYFAYGPQHRLTDYCRADLPAGVTVGDLHLGRYLQALATGNWRHAQAEKQVVYHAAAGEGSNVSGGYLVPSPLSAMVIDIARAQSVISEAGAKFIPAGSDMLTIARVASDPAIEVKAENAAFTETQPTFDQVTLVFRLLGCYVVMSRELAEDSSNGPELFEQVMAKALGSAFDTQCLAGDGTELGFPGLVYTDGVNTIEGVGSPTYDDFLNAIQLVESDNGTPKTMIVDPTTKYSLATLKVNSEDNHYCNVPPDVAKLQRLTTTAMPSGYATVGDWTQMLVGLRQEPRIEVSTVAGDAFKKHQVCLKITMRGDMALAHADHFCVLSGIT